MTTLPQGAAATAPGDPAADPALLRLLDRVRAAAADGTALCIRGGASKDFYGGTPRGAALDTRDLCGISSYEPTEMVISARAGTPLAEIESVLAEKGQCLAFEPPRFAPGGTVGGMVAAGLSGPARASVGCVRDFLLGAVLLNGRAEVLRFGGQVMKNVAGYDVARVLPGSLGILGVLCEVSLKVLPMAPARATLAFDCGQARAIELVQDAARAALPVNASAWIDEKLHLRLAGAGAAVRAAATRLAAEQGGRPLDEDAAQAFWTALRDQQHAFFTPPGAAALRLWRLSLPPTRPPLVLDGRILWEWGGAQRWLWTDAPPEAVRPVVTAAGGHATVFRGTPRTDDFLAALPENLMQFHKSLKQAFDPNNVFNPGRLYSWL